MPAVSGSPSPTLARSLQRLLEARCGRPVTLVETHISWVLLDGEQAWKLKKPVRMGFLDFSTPQARAHCCREELRLNQRLAASVYLRVAPVSGTPEDPVIEGAGEPIDHLVVMRQFPPGSLLSEQLAAGQLRSELIDLLVRRLARFHEDAPVAPPGSAFGQPETIIATAGLTLDRLEAVSGEAACSELRAWLHDQAMPLTPAWRARVAAGRVREGHGDLHLANTVALEDEVTAFDCIEFDPTLRWIDVMDDLAFLLMDLLAHGRPDLAWRGLDGWLEVTGDVGGLRVLRHALVRRAMVRALVQRLQTHVDAAQPDYLATACGLMIASRPALLLTHGLSGSGKSTLALRLVEAAGAVRLRSDVERKRLHGLAAGESSAGRAADMYGPQATARTFERLRSLAHDSLCAGWPTIVDAASLRRDERERFQRLANDLGMPFAILDCQAPVEVLRERVAARQARGSDASEADVQVLERQLDWQEPLTAHEQGLALRVDTTQAVDADRLTRSWLG